LSIKNGRNVDEFLTTGSQPNSLLLPETIAHRSTQNSPLSTSISSNSQIVQATEKANVEHIMLTPSTQLPNNIPDKTGVSNLAPTTLITRVKKRQYIGSYNTMNDQDIKRVEDLRRIEEEGKIKEMKNLDRVFGSAHVDGAVDPLGQGGLY
jgi:hypothetical protein